jgi:hypothetical protein
MTTTLSSSPLPRPPRVSIAQRAAAGFARHAFVHGYSLYAGRHVVVTSASPTAVEAVVRTSRVRRVHVRVEGGGIAIGCGCGPTSLDGPVGCKHAWAALLEVDRTEGLGAARGSTAPLVVTRLAFADAPEPEAAPPPAPAGEPDAPPRQKKRSDRARRREEPSAPAKKARAARAKKAPLRPASKARPKKQARARQR